MAEPSSEARGDASETDAESFESCLDRLEHVVEQLESGELALEQALGAFEEGVRLSKRCAAQLERAEQRVALLTEEGGAPALRPFEPASEDG